MPITNNLNCLRDWMEERVCPKVLLKVPDNNAMGQGYPYRLANPSAFVLFLPGKDRLPDKAPPAIPSVCIQLVEGEENPIGREGRMRIRFLFSAWNPGLYGPDKIEDGSVIRAEAVSLGKKQESREPPPECTADSFQRDGEGWQDAWNFVDTALRELLSVDYIGLLRLMREEKIKFGPVAEQGALVDYYPEWFAWAECWFSYGSIRVAEGDELL